MSLPRYNKPRTKEQIAAAKEKNKELIELCKNVCEKHGGLTEVGGGYFIVDSKKYKVSPRDH